VLAEIIRRDGATASAAQTWQRAIVDADHLAVLHAMWTMETMSEREQRYRRLLQPLLPPRAGQQPSDTERWLHRTLRAAELAGLDPGEVLAAAVGERDLTGARDIPAVIDARIRLRHGALVPLPAVRWSAQVPETGNPERRRYLTQLAMVMDDRRRRIGEHAAAANLPWAVAALGLVPADPGQQKAAAIGAYRELSGHTRPDDPIGPEPTANNPDLRAAWHTARAALTPADDRDVQPPDLAELSRTIEEIAAQRRELAVRAAEHQRLSTQRRIFPLTAAVRSSAILQPPKPEIPVSSWTLQRLADRDLDREAGG
jgi:hypothetical protein